MPDPRANQPQPARPAAAPALQKKPLIPTRSLYNFKVGDEDLDALMRRMGDELKAEAPFRART